MSLRVVKPGLATSVQDLGRVGSMHAGVGRSGALDTVALRLANALVGNAGHRAGLELTLRGPRLRFERDALIALTGASIDARVGDIAIPGWRPVHLPAGSELECSATVDGCRSYLAVAAGIDVPAVLGSRSTDINAALGPCQGRTLDSGDRLPLHPWRRTGDRGLSWPGWSLDPRPWFRPSREVRLRVLAGSHLESLDESSAERFFSTPFRLGSDSNRVGSRLQGEALHLREAQDIISTGVAPGTVQLPPSGEPIVLLAEAPTSGGYPRLAHVITVDLPLLAQARPGDAVRFERVDLQRAHALLAERERRLTRLISAIATRLVKNPP